MGDKKILDPTREPLVISCEQCSEILCIVVGDVDAHHTGTHLCIACVKRLAKWLEYLYGGGR